MKIVIQCAGRKQPRAASFLAPDGRPVLFLAHPEMAPSSAGHVYARPDEVSHDGRTWRSRLLDYNRKPEVNPLNLLPAYRLYTPEAYSALVEMFGISQVFILSAGWGLIPAAFLTPNYDITFTGDAKRWKRRRKTDHFEDYCLMPDDGDEIVFLGGQAYLRLFSTLTASFKGNRRVFFKSARRPELPEGSTSIKYSTPTRNWHYECAMDFIAGEIGITTGDG